MYVPFKGLIPVPVSQGSKSLTFVLCCSHKHPTHFTYFLKGINGCYYNFYYMITFTLLQARSWRKVIQVNIELMEVRRQTDQSFISLLQAVRVGR